MSTQARSKATVAGALACAVSIAAIATAWQAKGADPSHAARAQSSFVSFLETHANAHLDNLPVQ
jgi:hypothetical protein